MTRGKCAGVVKSLLVIARPCEAISYQRDVSVLAHRTKISGLRKSILLRASWRAQRSVVRDRFGPTPACAGGGASR